MPLPVVVKPLTPFVENGLRSVYTSTSQKSFDNAFEQFFSKHLEVTFNGQKSTRAHLKQELWNEKHQERRGTVNFLGTVEVDNHDKKPKNVSGRIG